MIFRITSEYGGKSLTKNQEKLYNEEKHKEKENILTTQHHLSKLITGGSL